MSWSDLNDSKRMMKGFMFVDALSVGGSVDGRGEWYYSFAV